MMYFEPLRYFFRDRQFLEHEVTELIHCTGYFFRDRQFLEHEVTELIHCTEPKLRGSATPCETLLFMALCSLTSTALFLTRHPRA